VNLTLANATGAVLGQSTAVLTISSDETIFTFTNQFFVVEGTPFALIPVTRTTNGSGPVSVQANTLDGTATAGLDYISVNTNLTWAAGDFTPKFVIVPIIDDNIGELDARLGFGVHKAIMRDRFAAAFGRYAAMEYLPSGVDTQVYRPDPEGRALIRKRHGLSDRPTVVCVSRLVPRKGQDMLIRALPKIRRRVPDAALLVVGGVGFGVYAWRQRGSGPPPTG